MDEHVSDSEGEQDLVQIRHKVSVPTDSISSFPVKPVASTKDSISSFSSVALPTRPKPKPIWKGAPAAPSVTPAVDDSYSGMSASERVKMRGRAASTIDSSFTSVARNYIPSEILEISSDSDDELAMAKDKKVRHKALSSGSALATSSSNGPPMPSPRQAVPKRPTLPLPFPHASSPLPPSDPFPHSTASTRYQVDGEEFVPPIAILPVASVDHSSSPTSGREEIPKSKKVKLKLPEPPPSDHVDELDDFEGESGKSRDAMMLPPPILGVSSAAAGPSTGPARETPIGAPLAKAPKKSRKKESVVEGEKPAKKPRAKKTKPEEGGGEKPKKKGKGKEKEKEKVFRSSEFIPDDADDDEPVAGPPPVHSLMDVDVDAPGPSGLKPISVVSIPDSQPDEELPLLIGEKRKRPDKEDEDAADRASEGKAKTMEKKSKKAKTPATIVDKTKKRPAKKVKGRVVMSEEEDGTGAEADSMVIDSAAPTSDIAPLAHTVVSESVVADERRVENAKPAKTKKAKKTVVPDSDGEGETREENVRPVKKRNTKVVVSNSASEGEGDDRFQNKPNENSPPRTSSESQVENDVKNKPPQKEHLEHTPKPSIASKYTIAPRTKSTPMAELIRRVNSRPGSPFPVVVSRRSSVGGAVSASNPGTPSTSYSPYHKFSRSALSRIAPLHPNRRTPPPPLPPPPPKPKTKKEKEREERWEEEMIEAIGGWDEWKLLSEQEQKAAKRAKWARELEGYED
ncbi:hypothetical protein B0H12DRAFT_337115, partial [Mycena haematopus]